MTNHQHSETTLIGLIGYGQSGKDEVGKALAEHYGFERLAFADPVRQMALGINPVVTRGGIRLSEVVRWDGWDRAKTNYPEIRMLLQHVGSSARDILGPTVWLDAAFNQMQEGRRYVLTDVRFENEADAIRARGGLLFRVVRPGVGPANAHFSEALLDQYPADLQISNHGDLKELSRRVCAIANFFISPKEQRI